MKKLILLSLVFIGCQKETIEPTKMEIEKIAMPIEWYINIKKPDSVTFKSNQQ